MTANSASRVLTVKQPELPGLRDSVMRDTSASPGLPTSRLLVALLTITVLKVRSLKCLAKKVSSPLVLDRLLALPVLMVTTALALEVRLSVPLADTVN
jgi:hypothetical protein